MSKPLSFDRDVESAKLAVEWLEQAGKLLFQISERGTDAVYNAVEGDLDRARTAVALMADRLQRIADGK